jgi:Cu2+-exporting ATPase
VHGGKDWREAALAIDGVHCQACIWLIDRHLREQPGVLAVDIDHASERVRLRWTPEQTSLGALLQAVADLRYSAQPFDTAHRERLLRDRRRRDGTRLIFAGLVGMPIMQFALASYIMGAAPGVPMPLSETIGRWTCLVAALAILTYPAQDFFRGVWRDLRNRWRGIDVPIASGLSTAFPGSVAATVRQPDDVNLDSIAMIVLFGLLARHAEMRGRVRPANRMDRLARIVPQAARRLAGKGSEEIVPVVDVAPGDRLRVLPE